MLLTIFVVMVTEDREVRMWGRKTLWYKGNTLIIFLWNKTDQFHAPQCCWFKSWNSMCFITLCVWCWRGLHIVSGICNFQSRHVPLRVLNKDHKTIQSSEFHYNKKTHMEVVEGYLMSFIWGIKANAHRCSQNCIRKAKNWMKEKLKTSKLLWISWMASIFANYVVTFARYSAKRFIFYWKHINHFFLCDYILSP